MRPRRRAIATLRGVHTFGFVFLLPLAATSLAGCHEPAARAEAQPAIPVAVVVPDGSAAVPDVVRYPVTIAYDREANLSFRIGGTLTAMPGRIGERISGGAVVARVDATPYAAARVRAQEDVARLARAAQRAHALVPAGAVAASTDEDSASAERAARAALANARYNESSALLRAPFAGVVLARQAELGETVGPGQTVLRVADLGSVLLAKAAVPQDVASTLRVGSAASVGVAGRAPVTASVRRIGAAADAKTGTVEIELALPAGLGLPSGLTGSVTFEAARTRTSGARIPAEALLDARGATGHIYIVDRRSTARRVAVGLLGFDGEQLRVTGLPAGARVITYGAGFVRDGQRVEAVRQ